MCISRSFHTTHISERPPFSWFMYVHIRPLLFGRQESVCNIGYWKTLIDWLTSLQLMTWSISIRLRNFFIFFTIFTANSATVNFQLALTLRNIPSISSHFSPKNNKNQIWTEEIWATRQFDRKFPCKMRDFQLSPTSFFWQCEPIRRCLTGFRLWGQCYKFHWLRLLASSKIWKHWLELKLKSLLPLTSHPWF